MPEDRKLSAIMFTDIQGYTALMQESEKKAVQLREKYRNIFDTATTSYGGEIVNYYGDGTLSTFSSAVRAVQCAIEMQEKFLTPPKVPVRIGIHQGDILTIEKEIYGDSVNLASRVESMAVPGSVLISEKVYEELENQDDMKTKDLGTFRFKNDHKDRRIFAMVSEKLTVPERSELKGKIELIPETVEAGGSFFRGSKFRRILLYSLVVLLVGILGSLYVIQQVKRNWAEKQAIPEIEKLYNEKDFKEAYQLAESAMKYIPDDPKLMELTSLVSEVIDIDTDPPGAKVLRRPLGGDSTTWEIVGISPLDSFRLYKGESVWRFEKEGYVPVERLAYQAYGHPWFWRRDTIKLNKTDEIPLGMVYIPATQMPVLLSGLTMDLSANVPEFFMDRYEVTNEKFKEFVDAGGYKKKEYWKHLFIKDNRQITFEEAVEHFKDKTNRAGPADWEVSDYPDGEDDFPVRGISWYEASAYAEFVNKELPTLFHFNTASTIYLGGLVMPYSNFSNKGPAPVGTYNSIGGFGTYDLIGNVREWLQTETTTGHLKFLMGGGWNDHFFISQNAWAQDPFNRSETNGFRCIKYIKPEDKSLELSSTVNIPERKDRNMVPVGDEVFQTYLGLYKYDKSPLEVDLEIQKSDQNAYECEKATINAAYGNERFDIYCYLPVNTKPPYQIVIIFPGAGVLWASEYGHRYFAQPGGEYIVKSGRAVIYPVFKSTFNRKDGVPDGFPRESVFYKEHMIMWTKDFMRTIDYLETREDMDAEKIAFYGISWGGITGGLIPAVDKRIKTIVLAVGGLSLQSSLPEVDQLNYLPRIKQPFLMMSGKYDFFFPYEFSQKPMLNLLGTPPEHKKHILSETTHFFPQHELIKETLGWLDIYLGEVEYN